MSKINDIKVNITTIGYNSAKAKLNDIEEQQDRILYKQKLIGSMESNVIKQGIRHKLLIDGVLVEVDIDNGGHDISKLAEELKFYRDRQHDNI